jgi:SAM-dependent methyltransferase
VLKAVKGQARRLLNVYPRMVCKREYGRQLLRHNERPIEFGFVFRQLARTYPRTILDVGTGSTALPHLMWNCGFLVTATDNIKDYWTSEVFNRHFHVIDDDITNTSLRQTFDLVTCVSVLEHIERSDAAVANMFRLLNPGGHLVLTCPYTEHAYVRNVYELPGSSYGQDASYVCQSYSRERLDKWLADNGGEIVAQEFWQFWDGEFWTVGNKLIPPREVTAAERHQLTCLLIRKKA